MRISRWFLISTADFSGRFRKGAKSATPVLCDHPKTRSIYTCSTLPCNSSVPVTVVEIRHEGMHCTRVSSWPHAQSAPAVQVQSTTGCKQNTPTTARHYMDPHPKDVLGFQSHLLCHCTPQDPTFMAHFPAHGSCLGWSTIVLEVTWTIYG